MEGQSISYKNELLFQNGINFDKLPAWQKRGMGLYWDSFEKVGHNPITGKDVVTARRGIKVDYDLPLRDDYSDFVGRFLM